MDFAYSEKSLDLQRRVRDFMDAHVIPRHAQFKEEEARGTFEISFMDDLKALAKEEGLWNMFLPGLGADEPGVGLSVLDYAPLAEIMGRLMWASEVFNCSAPDTGNMEILHMFGTPEQKETWLKPLLNGEIRSAFSMTEPDSASSDATNIATVMRREGDEYVINGRKWFSTGAASPRCKLSIVMGKTDPDNPDRHRQQSMILVPLDAPGVKIVRNTPVMNHVDYESHCEIAFENVRVPVSNLLGEEGSGFAIAQARLGPGRIHHCMRSIGQAELAHQMMVERSLERKTFGRYLHEHGMMQEKIARNRMEIDQARLLVLKAAWLIDQFGVKAARTEVSMIKVVVPEMQQRVVDRAMQTFGGMGVTPDTPLPNLWTMARSLRLADGPDEVHMRTLARMEVRKAQKGAMDTHRFMTLPDRANERDMREGREGWSPAKR
ncbi:acyl-CoA dehydrogenase family protein [Rhodalgimonas zhirmunskyi]|uniref:Acyl-CoA dehydrogenase family protein n=1 Tax=Rhodalgimonas zhirmunskyi TaxID=2964767 RepID=A0AAJ1X8E2_9RHOB|nr:acyl-CoA dehydrogenase family protein [Rhodoalgimonas zhirmunskyi]MDQ2095527.1 acyl-CoA dehydrogenase family protein [Rhodoalgimonas zhirmunskyi]